MKKAKKGREAEVSVPKAQRAGKRATQVKDTARNVAGRAVAKGQQLATDRRAGKNARRCKPGRKRWLIGVIALVLLIAGGITAAICLWDHEVPPEEVSQEGAPEPEPEPEPEPQGPPEGNEPLIPEMEIPDWSAYTVADNKPRYLSIETIGLQNIPVIEVGTIGENVMDAPKNIHIVGWYYRSAYPGRVGTWATVIDGHGGGLGDGVFKNLPELGIGGEIVIEMGDGKKYTYVVAEKVLKTKGAEADAYMKIADRPLDAETPTLTLITCTGQWIRAEQTYTHRLFVKAALKNE